MLKKYSMPLLTSMLQNATAYIMASGRGSSTSSSGTSTEDARSQAAEDARQNFIQQMDSIFNEILESKANIKAITYVPAGTRIIIFPNEDLWLNSEEREKKKGTPGYMDSGYSGSGLVETNPDGSADGGRNGGNVTYSGNYRENVAPVSGGAQQANTGRSPAGYTPPPAPANSSQPPVVPDANSGGGGDDNVPELL